SRAGTDQAISRSRPIPDRISRVRTRRETGMGVGARVPRGAGAASDPGASFISGSIRSILLWVTPSGCVCRKGPTEKKRAAADTKGEEKDDRTHSVLPAWHKRHRRLAE